MTKDIQFDIAYEQHPADQVNFLIGRQGHRPNQIVLHSMDGFMAGTIQLFATPRPDNPTSAHYSIGWDGNIVQHVDERDTAYHAGDWNVNVTSIGVEHEDLGQPYIKRPDALYETSAKLVADICKRFNLPCDSSHVRIHSEVSDNPTSCPTGLDRDRIVARAQQLLLPQPAVGGVGENPTPQHTVTITPDIGANIRTSPSISGANVAKTFPKGTVVAVDGFVPGDIPPGGHTNLWWKLLGDNLFVYTEVTSEVPVPAAPVTPTPEPTPAPQPAPAPDPIPVPPIVPDPTPAPVQTIDSATKTQLDQLIADNAALMTKVTNLQKQLTDTQQQVADLTTKNDGLESDMKDYLILKKANEVLSDQIQIYKTQQTQSLVTAFSGWEMFDLPQGMALLARLGLALRLFLLPANSPYVVGWKDHMKLTKVG